MKFSEYLTEATKINWKDRTNVPFYDDVITNASYMKRAKGIEGKIVNMTPDEYINAAIKVLDAPRDRVLKGREGTPTVEKLEKLMRDGKPFDLPYLNYSKVYSGQQEGLHRALAARNIDPKGKIPVLVVVNV